MISVIAASYNHRKYIERCLTSIMAQDVDELELIWIDDHSSDGTFKEVQRILEIRHFRNRFSRIVLRQNTVNRGAHYTLNLGCRVASNPVLSLINTDDYYHPARLATMSSRYAGERYWLAFSNVLAVDEWEVPLPVDRVGQAVMFDADRLVAFAGSVSAALLTRQIASSTGNIMLTRALFDALGGFANLRYCHDWMLMLNACWFCEPCFVPERLYYYRLHASNSFRALSSVADSDPQTVRRAFLQRLFLNAPLNETLISPQRDPVRFWDGMAATGLTEMARSVLMPYAANTRMLDAGVARHAH